MISSRVQTSDMYTPQMEDYNAFYGDASVLFACAQSKITQLIQLFRAEQINLNHSDPIEHFKSRIKRADHMMEKLLRRKLPVTLDAALHQIYDAVGFRIVCTFINDVYLVRDWLASQSEIKVIEEKDYIKKPKENGYRSCHLIIEIDAENANVYAEIQIRTLAMDCWAAMEHQLKYKHDIPHQEMFVHELKRFADEIASTDLNLEAIREMIEGDKNETVVG